MKSSIRCRVRTIGGWESEARLTHHRNGEVMVAFHGRELTQFLRPGDTLIIITDEDVAGDIPSGELETVVQKVKANKKGKVQVVAAITAVTPSSKHLDRKNLIHIFCSICLSIVLTGAGAIMGIARPPPLWVFVMTNGSLLNMTIVRTFGGYGEQAEKSSLSLILSVSAVFITMSVAVAHHFCVFDVDVPYVKIVLLLFFAHMFVLLKYLK